MVDLSGLHILLTRPEDQAKQSSEGFIAAGARVTCHPFLSIAPLQETAEEQAITNRISALDVYQKMIFVSQNAVHYGVQWIDRFWPQLPLDLEFFAVGKATANRLQLSLSRLDATVQSPAHAMNSETLLALPGLQSVRGQKILIARGRGGRTKLAQVLSARGAHIDYCELYQRQLPDAINPEQLQHFRQTSEQSIVVALSCETLANLQTLLLEWSPDYWQWLKTQVLVVPGQRVAELAKKQNFQVIVVANNATQDSIAGAINDWRKRYPKT